ncbi:thioester domain-containing protein [Marinactinospora thermotolerans]|uniref:TQXA domain-containing protein n=1 Tax=Marinactinospora thermotolerans DSM 45154 TaxID=1122192 RepID=A0A1T4SER0_9ACTN|nr:thioester domain-containing protein [Marinactinospora thermotolerans]SKA26675.1 TQXA domain-containing protein [Marinactinospora thermotolerans DSM 45154]
MIEKTLPPSPRWRNRAITTVAGSAAALLAFGLAAPGASADEVYSGGAQGKYTGNVEKGFTLDFGSDGKVGTTLFELTLTDGAKLPAYCIDFVTPIRSGASYSEGAWSEYPGEGDFANSQPGKVLWILQNSYPRVSAEELAQASGVEDLDAKEAMSATQAAIWHHSNGVELKGGGGREHRDDILDFYDYLLENAQEVESHPASLTITPNEASGKAGETIGEFTVETTAESVPLTLNGPDGVSIVDAEGKEIETAANGGTFAVKVDEGVAPGEATVSSSISTEVQIGRLFKGVDPNKPTQTLITAGDGTTEASAQAKVTWTEGTPAETPSPSPSESPSEEPSTPPSTPPASPPASTPPAETPPADKPTPPADEKPGNSLPVTGAALGGLVAAAVVAIGGGGAAMYLSRKRKAGRDA